MTAEEELSEIYKAKREHSQLKRGQNRENSAKILADVGITFDGHNGGSHLVVYGSGDRVIDFWPGTGLWKVRNDTTKGRGVRKLIDFVGKGE